MTENRSDSSAELLAVPKSDTAHITTTYASKPKSDAEHQADMTALAIQQLDGIFLRTFPSKGAHAVEPGQSAGDPKRRIVRKTSSQVHLRDTKICSIAEELNTDEYAIKADHLQPPLTPRQLWRDKGCPSSMGKAVGNAYWRKMVADERRNAWLRHKKVPH